MKQVRALVAAFGVAWVLSRPPCQGCHSIFMFFRLVQRVPWQVSGALGWGGLASAATLAEVSERESPAQAASHQLSSPLSLSPASLEELRVRGYLVIDGVLDEAALVQARAECAGLQVAAMWKAAAQRLRPARPTARPASARSSSGRPSASATPVQSADVLWLAGHTGLIFHTGLVSSHTGRRILRCDGPARGGATLGRRALALGGALALRRRHRGAGPARRAAPPPRAGSTARVISRRHGQHVDSELALASEGRLSRLAVARPKAQRLRTWDEPPNRAGPNGQAAMWP